MKHEYTESLYDNILKSLEDYKEVQYPVYILSKGRTDGATMKLLDKIGLKYYLVVEPQEYMKYSSTLKIDPARLVPLLDNDRGVSFARNYCKRHSKLKGHAFHWQIDDNIQNFCIRQNNKNVKYEGVNLLAAAEHVMNQFDNVGILGLCHVGFAFAKANHIDINKQVYSCVLVKNSLDIEWRENVVEDTDYSLQVLSLNECTLLMNRFLIDKQTTSTNSGGNDNSDEWRLNRSKGLQKLWPGAFEITHQYGRVKVKPSRIWSTFKHMPRGPNIDLNPITLEEFFDEKS